MYFWIGKESVAVLLIDKTYYEMFLNFLDEVQMIRN